MKKLTFALLVTSTVSIMGCSDDNKSKPPPSTKGRQTAQLCPSFINDKSEAQYMQALDDLRSFETKTRLAGLEDLNKICASGYSSLTYDCDYPVRPQIYGFVSGWMTQASCNKAKNDKESGAQNFASVSTYDLSTLTLKIKDKDASKATQGQYGCLLNVNGGIPSGEVLYNLGRRIAGSSEVISFANGEYKAEMICFSGPTSLKRVNLALGELAEVAVK